MLAMLRKYIYFFILLLASTNLVANQVPKAQVYCIKELQPTLETLRKLPEIEALIQRILKDGSLTIKYNERLSTKFMGYWDPYNRAILITDKPNLSEADRISTMLFEMHNASRSNDFKEIDDLAYQRKLTQEEYMRESEYVEYENCLATSRLLAKGIERGLFPTRSAWAVDDNFEDHYKWMKKSGHAGWYATTYKKMR